MLTRILVLCIALAGSVPQAAAEMAVDELDRVVEHFFEQRGRSAPHSLSVSVSADGRLVAARAYGEASPGVPAQEDTIYQIGSLTKQFTAAAMLKLIDQGGRAPRTRTPLALDAEFATLVDGFDHWSRGKGGTVTIRRLLNMTSNLPNITRRPPMSVDPWGAVRSPELLGALKSYEPKGWPDTFEYSNTSYFLLAEIMDGAERGDGVVTNYKTEMRRLFVDAGMRSTGFVGERGDTPLFAKPHYDRTPVFIKGDWLKGSGDVTSTAIDMFLWNKSLMEGRLLRPELRETLFADGGRVSPTVWYGMGFFIEQRDGRDEYTHTGAVPGFSSFNGIFRNRNDGRWVSVTLLANSGGLEGLEVLGSDLADRLLAR